MSNQAHLGELTNTYIKYLPIQTVTVTNLGLFSGEVKLQHPHLSEVRPRMPPI
jgi:hypothetical protein